MRYSKPLDPACETDLARIQALVLDSVGPLVQALEGIRDGSLTFDDADHAVSSAIALLGNASSHISKLRSEFLNWHTYIQRATSITL